MLSEAVIIAAICLVINLGTGSVMAQPIADKMLASRVAAAEADSAASGGDNFLMAEHVIFDQ